MTELIKDEKDNTPEIIKTNTKLDIYEYNKLDPQRWISKELSMDDMNNMSEQNQIQFWRNRSINNQQSLYARSCLQTEFDTWTYFNEETVARLVEFIGGQKNNTVLEGGAGSALLAYFLQSNGIHVIPTDNGSEIKTNTKIYTDIIKLDATEAVVKYPTNILLAVWPRYGVLQSAMKKFNGEFVIFCGELGGGCTDCVDNDDFELLETIESHIPYACIYDHLMIYKRKTSKEQVEKM